jgi:hypothetical protein
MPLVGIRPGVGGTLTSVANKCSIVRNARCRMNMYLPRRPDPCPFFFPDLSSTATTHPSFPAVAHISHYADSSGGARARSWVQDCRSSRDHSIDLDLVGELSGFEAEDTRRDRKACVEAKQVAVAGHPSDGEN